MSKRILGRAVGACAVLWAVCMHQAGAMETPASQVPRELLLQFAAATPEAERISAMTMVQAELRQTLRPGLLRVSLPEGLSLDAAARQLARLPGVDFAEPNLIYRPAALTEAPRRYEDLRSGAAAEQRPWLADRSGALQPLAGGCPDVAVAVLDTGAQFQHRDLRGNHWTNPGEVPGNGIDDDGNGLIDDVDGWDFVHQDGSVYDDAEADLHGTHLSGLIGAQGRDPQGVFGLCERVQLINVKFMDAEGGTLAHAVQAIDYLIDLKRRHRVPLVAVNASWGSPHDSQALRQAVQRLGEAEIVLVAAAGGGGLDNDRTPFFPASLRLPHVLSLAALNGGGRLWAQSNRGAQSVDLAAPGVGIRSTAPPFTYRRLDGSSMAAAFTTGALAMLAQRHPDWRAAQLRQGLLDTVAPTASLAGQTHSAGRLDTRSY